MKNANHRSKVYTSRKFLLEPAHCSGQKYFPSSFFVRSPFLKFVWSSRGINLWSSLWIHLFFHFRSSFNSSSSFLNVIAFESNGIDRRLILRFVVVMFASSFPGDVIHMSHFANIHESLHLMPPFKTLGQ
jgi:hypothetical protein